MPVNRSSKRLLLASLTLQYTGRHVNARKLAMGSALPFRISATIVRKARRSTVGTNFPWSGRTVPGLGAAIPDLRCECPLAPTSKTHFSRDSSRGFRAPARRSPMVAVEECAQFHEGCDDGVGAGLPNVSPATVAVAHAHYLHAGGASGADVGKESPTNSASPARKRSSRRTCRSGSGAGLRCARVSPPTISVRRGRDRSRRKPASRTVRDTGQFHPPRFEVESFAHPGIEPASHARVLRIEGVEVIRPRQTCGGLRFSPHASANARRSNPSTRDPTGSLPATGSERFQGPVHAVAQIRNGVDEGAVEVQHHQARRRQPARGRWSRRRVLIPGPGTFGGGTVSSRSVPSGPPSAMPPAPSFRERPRAAASIARRIADDGPRVVLRAEYRRTRHEGIGAGLGHGRDGGGTDAAVDLEAGPHPSLVEQARARRSVSREEGMNACPPKPGFTDITRTRSRRSSTPSRRCRDESGLRASPALQPCSRMSEMLSSTCSLASG